VKINIFAYIAFVMTWANKTITPFPQSGFWWILVDFEYVSVQTIYY